MAQPPEDKKTEKTFIPIDGFSSVGISGCGCSSTCCGSSATDAPVKTKLMSGSVTIDGQVLKFTEDDKNLVDVAARAKIGIPAPCYRDQRKNGCCNSCVVEVNGEQKFACSTVPEDGMNITIDRPDLKVLRKERLMEYKEGIKTGNPCKCSVSGDSGNCCG